MTTTFQKNSKLNLAFGNEAGDVTNPDIAKIRNQAKLILEELCELLTAAYFDHEISLDLVLKAKPSSSDAYAKVDMEKVMKEIMDAQGDITTVNDGLAHIAGFNGDECLQRVYASNMSKFIRNALEVGPALQYYYDLGFEEHMLSVEGEFPRAFIRVVDTVTVGGKEYPKGKFLKNMPAFQEPDFSDMLTNKPILQTTRIVCSMGVEEKEIQFSHDSTVAVGSPNLFVEIMEKCQNGSVEHIKFGDQIESIVPVYHITETQFPDIPQIWGHWKGNSRHYVANPANFGVTELTRID